MSKYLILDTETGIREEFGRKGSPWYNEIVAIGLKFQDAKEADTIYNLNDIENGLNFVLSQNNYSIMVGHNIKFDLLHLWKYDSLQNWLKNGGRIWDTQLAEYMLTGQQSKYAALREIAVKKYGCLEREKLMEKYWEQGIDTKDIPKELVLEDVKNDVLDTEAIMLQQVKEAKKIGMYQLIMEEMDSLLATTEMEWNGIHIQQRMMEENQRKTETEIQEITKKLEVLSGRYWKR